MSLRTKQTKRGGNQRLLRKIPWISNGFVPAAGYLYAVPAFLSFGYATIAAGDLWWHLADGLNDFMPSDQRKIN